MKKTNLITICLVILFVCGNFVIRPNISQAQKKDVGKKSPTPAQTASPTPNDSPTQGSTNNTNSKNPNSKEKKKIVVVLDFDNVSPQCQDEIYGKNVAVQLSNAFTTTGEYTVIEKQRIDKIIEEIGFSQEEIRDPANAAKVGKIASASTVVLGTITQCSPDTKIVNLGVAKMIQHTVKVSLAIRLVNINTGEIQDAVSVSKNESDRSGCLPIGCVITAITPDLQIKLFNKAVEKAVKDSVKQLSSIIENPKKGGTITPIVETPKPTSGNTPQPTPTRTNSLAKVVAVNGTTIYITGLGSVIKVGDVISIVRGKEIKNAETGEVLDFDGKEIAKAEVIEVNERTIKAKVIGGAIVKELDFVKPLN